MANNPSQEKRIRQDVARRDRNRSVRSEMRKSVKQLRAAIEAGNVDTAQALLKPTLSLVDASARGKVLHRNAAARTKSRLVRAVRALSENS